MSELKNRKRTKGNRDSFPGEEYLRCGNGCEFAPPGVPLRMEHLSYFGMESVIAGTTCPQGGNADGMTFAEIRLTSGSYANVITVVDEHGNNHRFTGPSRIAICLEGDIENQDLAQATRFISDVLGKQSRVEPVISKDRKHWAEVRKRGANKELLPAGPP